MKKLMLVLICALSIAFAGNVLADPNSGFDGAGFYKHSQTGNVKPFDKHPGEPSQWTYCGATIDECYQNDPDPDPDPVGCGGDCYSDWYIEGYAEQMSGVSMIKGQSHPDGDLTVLDNGAMGFATQSSLAGYWAEDCGEDCYSSGAIGGAITVGGSSLWGDNNADSAWMAGLTGSGSVAFLLGSNFYGEVYVEGMGEMGTMAFKEKGNQAAGASSYGNYMYEASAGGSSPLVVAGGVGLTGGGSYVHNSGNNVSAVSGQISISAGCAGGLTLPSID